MSTIQKTDFNHVSTPAAQFVPPKNWGEFPFLYLVPKHTNILPVDDQFKAVKNHSGYACNLNLIENIRRNGHAKIINSPRSVNGSNPKSIFSLKCFWKPEYKRNGHDYFVFRSDHFPRLITFAQQWQEMIKLADKNLQKTTTMQLFDNRRTEDENQIYKWSFGKLIETNEFVPFEFPDPELTDSVKQFGENNFRTNNTYPTLWSEMKSFKNFCPDMCLLSAIFLPVCASISAFFLPFFCSFSV